MGVKLAPRIYSLPAVEIDPRQATGDTSITRRK
jgi:hypothetical protein